jgi:hypothetical protein
MTSHSRVVLGSVIGVGILMIFFLSFHVGGEGPLAVGNFSPLLGAFIGGTLALVCAYRPVRQGESVEPWLGNERLAWILIGCGCVAWGIGESFWRYYEALGQTPFPSLADMGYASFPPLVFVGLLLLPFLRSSQRRVFLLLDILITVGALLSIAWFLLLGSLAQTPAESVLAKVLGEYYPTADVALVSCVVFLLLRGGSDGHQASARRISLLVAVLGLCAFTCSDFLFNVQSNIGTYVEGTWIDLGWPLGMMALGAAAYLRRFLPATSYEVLDQQQKQRAGQLRSGPAQALPYLLIGALFCVLIINVLSGDHAQQSIRPVLVGATVIVIGLVLVRQFLTIRENIRLMQEQVALYKQLEQVNQDNAKRKTELEAGVNQFKEVQTRLANGDVRARARLQSGDLWPLAEGLNHMADRMMKSEQRQKIAMQSMKAMDDLSQALEEHTRRGIPLVLPASCYHLPEIQRLLLAMGWKPALQTPLPEITPAAGRRQPLASPMRRWRESSKPHQDSSGAT